MKSTEGVVKPSKSGKNLYLKFTKTKMTKSFSSTPTIQRDSIPTLNQPNQEDYTVLVMDVMIDNHFMQHLEMKDGDITFKRVDADALDSLIDKDEQVESVLNEKEVEQLKEAFFSTIADENFQVECKALIPKDYPVTLTQSEWMRHERNESNGRRYGDDG